jgi:hypothetical protein
MHGVASGSIKGAGVPKTVAKDFVAADKGKSQAKLPERKAPLARVPRMAAPPAGPSMSDTVMPVPAGPMPPRRGGY